MNLAGTKAVRRISMPLTERDSEDLALIQHSPEARRQLNANSGSEGAVARAVFEEGVKAILERMSANAYQQMKADEEEASLARTNRERLIRRGRDRVVD